MKRSEGMEDAEQGMILQTTVPLHSHAPLKCTQFVRPHWATYLYPGPLSSASLLLLFPVDLRSLNVQFAPV